MTEQDQLAAGFETHRPYLHAIAFRVLGSDADADDAVQEAWLRLARAGADGIEDLRGWLTTATGRICLDVLRRREPAASTRWNRTCGPSRATSAPIPRRRPCSPTRLASPCTS